MYILFYLNNTCSHVSLTVFLAARETFIFFLALLDKCPAACVNGADESVREKRRQIGGVKAFIDKNIHKKTEFTKSPPRL